MFDFFKKKRNNNEPYNEKTPEQFLEEFNYKMEHDPEYRASVEKSARFFKADQEARKKAGLENKPGTYTFTCPNCNSLCKGSWVLMGQQLHGSTGCSICNIHLMV